MGDSLDNKDNAAYFYTCLDSRDVATNKPVGHHMSGVCCEFYFLHCYS